MSSLRLLNLPALLIFLPGGAAESGVGAEAAVAVADGSTEDGEKDGKKPKKNRCHECRKKVGLTGLLNTIIPQSEWPDFC